MHDPLLDARPEWTLLWRTMLGQVARFEWGLYIKESNMAKKKRKRLTVGESGIRLSHSSLYYSCNFSVSLKQFLTKTSDNKDIESLDQKGYTFKM